MMTFTTLFVLISIISLVLLLIAEAKMLGQQVM